MLYIVKGLQNYCCRKKTVKKKLCIYIIMYY